VVMAPANKLQGNPKGFSRQGKSGYFMMGIATEGMYYHWLLTGDKETFATLKTLGDFQIDEGRKGQNGNAACGVAFLYNQLGDEAYRKAAISLIKTSPERRPKGFGLNWRNTPYALYYLSTLPQKP